MKKMVFILFIIAINITCKQEEQGNRSLSNAKRANVDSGTLSKLPETNNQDTSYYKAEIYCWCFGDTPLYKKKDGLTVMQGQLCETPFRINAEDLIKQNRLYYSTTDKHTINGLKDLLFNRADSIKKINYSINSRFLILFRKNTGVDTFNFYSVNNFVLNGDDQYSYSFNILDSVSKRLKVKYIKCPS
jgi:hypothetical protein